MLDVEIQFFRLPSQPLSVLCLFLHSRSIALRHITLKTTSDTFQNYTKINGESPTGHFEGALFHSALYLRYTSAVSFRSSFRSDEEFSSALTDLNDSLNHLKFLTASDEHHRTGKEQTEINSR